MRPNGSRIVVRRLDPKEVSDGGIIIPDAAREISSEGTVIFAGDESKFEPGHQVVFGRYAGTEVSFEGETLLILRDDDVMVVRI